MALLHRALLLLNISLRDLRVIQLQKERLYSIVTSVLENTGNHEAQKKEAQTLCKILVKTLSQKINRHPKLVAIYYKKQLIILPLLDSFSNVSKELYDIITNLSPNLPNEEVIKALLEELPVEEAILTDVLNPYDENDWRQIVYLVKKALNKCFSQSLELLKNGISISDENNRHFKLKANIRFLKILPQLYLGVLVIPSLSQIGKIKTPALDTTKEKANEALREQLNKIFQVKCFLAYKLITPQSQISIHYDIDRAIQAIRCLTPTKSMMTALIDFYTIDSSALNFIRPSASVQRRFHGGMLQGNEKLYIALRKWGPYDKTLKSFNKIRLLFLIHKEEHAKIKEATSKIASSFIEAQNELPKLLGLENEELSFEILDDKPVEFSLSSDDSESIEDVLETYGIRQFSEALRNNEVDIILVGTSSHRNYPIISNADKFYYSPKKYFTERNIQNQFLSGYGLLQKNKRGFVGILDAFNQKGWDRDIILKSPEFLNLLLNIYIKATGKPWIVEQASNSLLHIFIGIKVYRVAEGYGEGVAIILDDTGSIIDIRTAPAHYGIHRKSYYLTKDRMAEIIQEVVLNVYEKRKMRKPDKVFLGIFRLGRFHEKELEGIIEAANTIKSEELDIQIAPISIMRGKIYPSTRRRGRRYIAIGSNGCMIIPGPDIHPTIAYIDKRLPPDIRLEWSVGDLVNCLEALYRVHWQTFWGSKLRFPPIIKFAENIANLRRRGLPEPSDKLLRKTPWFI